MLEELTSVTLLLLCTQVFHWHVRKNKKKKSVVRFREDLGCVLISLPFPFSATWPDGVRRLAKSYLRNPMIVYVGTLDLAVSGVVLKYLQFDKEIFTWKYMQVNADDFKISLEFKKNSVSFFVKLQQKFRMNF